MAPVQSQPLAPDADEPAAVPAAKGWKLPWWIYMVDLLDAVPTLAFLAALVAFNKSELGRRFYKSLVERFPDKLERARYMMDGLTGKIGFATFWVMSLLFAVPDLLKWPKWLYRRRIQPRDPPPASYWAKVAVLNLASTYLILGPVSKYVVSPIWYRRGGVEHATKIPSAVQSVKEYLLCELWFEFWLYTSHRVMHLPWLYPWAHKRHHVHSNPFSVANFYATPFEHVWQNAPAGLAMQLLPVHPSTAWFFIAYRYFETVTSHSGYALPFSTNALFHNHHHRAFEGNYGINAGFPLMDLLMGTADDYLKWRLKWAETHHWFTNAKIAEDKELDFASIDKGGQAL
ncbi:hypothetical protein DFJ74DRAFT_650209 [Hyaloraphidium curvatum]|nr:hypothetical protein DFJ74DRAFT_650209 [Hyaloraphidium curvatum]